MSSAIIKSDTMNTTDPADPKKVAIDGKSENLTAALQLIADIRTPYRTTMTRMIASSILGHKYTLTAVIKTPNTTATNGWPTGLKPNPII